MYPTAESGAPTQRRDGSTYYAASYRPQGNDDIDGGHGARSVASQPGPQPAPRSGSHPGSRPAEFGPPAFVGLMSAASPVAIGPAAPSGVDPWASGPASTDRPAGMDRATARTAGTATMAAPAAPRFPPIPDFPTPQSPHRMPPAASVFPPPGVMPSGAVPSGAVPPARGRRGKALPILLVCVLGLVLALLAGAGVLAYRMYVDATGTPADEPAAQTVTGDLGRYREGDCLTVAEATNDVAPAKCTDPGAHSVLLRKDGTVDDAVCAGTAATISLYEDGPGTTGDFVLCVGPAE